MSTPSNSRHQAARTLMSTPCCAKASASNGLHMLSKALWMSSDTMATGSRYSHDLASAMRKVSMTSGA
eukprot:1117520-Lingulodinium_polyedra.AAC.1